MSQFAYFWPALATQLAVILAFFTFFQVGQARGRYGILPPAMQGPAEFERILRVQANTVEHLVLFLPSLWMFSLYVSSFWGGILGLLWVIARIVYIIGYRRSTPGRMPGMLLSVVILAILMFGGLAGIIYSWIILT